MIKRFASLPGYNYCGYGRRGGRPVDEVDRACAHHSIAYRLATSPVDLRAADEALVERLDRLPPLPAALVVRLAMVTKIALEDARVIDQLFWAD